MTAPSKPSGPEGGSTASEGGKPTGGATVERLIGPPLIGHDFGEGNCNVKGCGLPRYRSSIDGRYSPVCAVHAWTRIQRGIFEEIDDGVRCKCGHCYGSHDLKDQPDRACRECACLGFRQEQP